MKGTVVTRTFLVGCAIAAAAACSNNGANNAANTGSTNPAAANQQASATRKPNSPVSINGCLQEGSGGTYLLTRINEPAHKDVGAKGPATAVEQEQLWLARNEYRIDPQKDVKIDDLVGKQVHVTGTLVDRADLPTAQQEENQNRPAATSGHSDDGADITQKDLAKIDATAVSMVSDSCGSGQRAAGTSGK